MQVKNCVSCVLSVQHEKSVIMAENQESRPRFETVSTSTLQIKVRVPRSPSPLAPSSSSSRSASMRPSRLECRPPPGAAAVSGGNGNQLAVSTPRSQYSRSLSPRQPYQRPSEVMRPPPPSPSGLLPTRSPTPPNHCHSVPNTPKIQGRSLI